MKNWCGVKKGQAEIHNILFYSRGHSTGTCGEIS